MGCAFAACLERKQRRDKECGVTMTFDSKTSTFTRSGSFRQPSLTEQFYDTRERSVGNVNSSIIQRIKRRKQRRKKFPRILNLYFIYIKNIFNSF